MQEPLVFQSQTMKCPVCGSSYLRISVTFTGTVDCDFGREGGFRLVDPVMLDSSLDESSECCCLQCHWEGTARDAGCNGRD